MQLRVGFGCQHNKWRAGCDGNRRKLQSINTCEAVRRDQTSAEDQGAAEQG